MIGLTLTVGGLACAALGWLLLRRSGPGWRIGRILSAAPQRHLADAVALASRGEQAYVRLHGRIDSAEEFPGDDDRPLVYRRRRLEWRSATRAWHSAWHTFDDQRLAVPFGLSERGERVEIDVEALGDGLVVVPRVSLGVASELPRDAVGDPPPPLAPDTPVRLRLEQVSSIDHGTACGVPRLGPEGRTILGPGLGRPLVLTTLDLDEAMRVLGSAQRRGLLAAAGLLLAAPILVVVGSLLLVAGR